MARWLEGMAEFNYEVVHRPGKQHCNADALSRGQCRQCGLDVHCTEFEEEEEVITAEFTCVVQPGYQEPSESRC